MSTYFQFFTLIHFQNLTSSAILLFTSTILLWAIRGIPKTENYHRMSIQDLKRYSIHWYIVPWSRFSHMSIFSLCCTSCLRRFYSNFIIHPGSTWYFSGTFRGCLHLYVHTCCCGTEVPSYPDRGVELYQNIASLGKPLFSQPLF